MANNGEKTVTAKPQSSMGLLRRLPAEVRLNIWQYFKIRPGRISSRQEGTNNFAILRTCHQLYDEISTEIYGKEILTFHISPLASDDWISISTSRAAQTHLSLEDFTSCNFHLLPYLKLQSVEIEIEAPHTAKTLVTPHREDAGQMICLRTKVMDLVDALAKVEKFSNIDVYLRETFGVWSSAGQPEKRVGSLNWTRFPGNHDEDEDEYRHDFEVLLLPFCRLRNVRKAGIHFVHASANMKSFAESVVLKMEQTKSFGTISNNGVWDDDKIQKRLEITQFQFASILDQVDGWTADFMRVEQFGRWSEGGWSKYVEDWIRIYRTNVRAWRYADLCDLSHRLRFLLYFNPTSVEMQTLRLQLDTLAYPNNHYRCEFIPELAWDPSISREDQQVEISATTPISEEFLMEGITKKMASRSEWHDHWQNGLPAWDQFNSFLSPYSHIKRAIALSAGSILIHAKLDKFERWCETLDVEDTEMVEEMSPGEGHEEHMAEKSLKREALQNLDGIDRDLGLLQLTEHSQQTDE